jgi:hypothetical protein
MGDSGVEHGRPLRRQVNEATAGNVADGIEAARLEVTLQVACANLLGESGVHDNVTHL